MFKYLGIYLPENLKWNEHVNYLYKIAQNSFYETLISFKTSSASILTNFFKIYVRPKLEYNTPIWSHYLKKDVIKIGSMERNPFCLQQMHHFKFNHTKID